MERTPPKLLSVSDTNLNRAESEPLIPGMNITVRSNAKRVCMEDSVVTDKFEQFKLDLMEQFTAMLAPLITRLDSVEKSLCNITQQNNDIRSSNVEIEKSLDFLMNQISESETKIRNLEEKINTTQISIAEIEEKSENIERFIRKTSIEIRGVPATKKESKEDLLNQISNLMKFIGINSCNEIKDIYRLPYKSSSITTTVVVEFTNIFAKEKFLRFTKQYNSENQACKLNSTHLGITGTPTPLYFSDHLTPKSRRLHFLARDFAATEKYRFCWIANGRIYLRKEEGAKYILVKNDNTIAQLRGN
ncbi:uncharacterized protein LOC124630914 [Helicoverpa zea]|uniref:uncharacterized protein LOC124630914 n=1 Tax=Helicoverpa zea TaxID=7113 RepID=UPI001F59DD7E|nr:uncharacterized protein LOC124630914 [Helicoverpa zea]